MHSANYYRGQAAKARSIARDVSTPTAANQLETIAEDYDDIADDLENGAASIRHPELMRQPGRKRWWAISGLDGGCETALSDRVGLFGQLVVVVGDVQQRAPGGRVAHVARLRTSFFRTLAPIFGTQTVWHDFAPLARVRLAPAASLEKAVP